MHPTFNQAMDTENHSNQTVLHNGLSDLLSVLGTRFIAFYPAFADITASAKAAIMLGHAVYMTRILVAKQPERDGWFYKTNTEWKQVTGLSTKEIRAARNVLTHTGIFHESIRGMPAKLWFRVDLDRLSLLLCEFGNAAYRPWSWEDRVLKILLGKPVMFYASLAHLANSAVAGLYLSHMVGCLRAAMQNNEVDRNGLFTTPLRQSKDRLKLGKHAIVNARLRLISIGVLMESRERSAQSQLVTRLDLQALASEISKKTTEKRNEIHCLSFNDNQECRNTTIKSSGFGKARVPVLAKQEFRFWQSKSSGFGKASFAESGTLYSKELNTTYKTLHNPKPEVVDLIYPENLLPNEKLDAMRALSMNNGCPNPQMVLDEWDGQMRTGTVRSPLRYLIKLRDLDAQGLLLCDHAHRIEAERNRKHGLLLQQAITEPAEPVVPVSREQARLKCAELRQMLRSSSTGRV